MHLPKLGKGASPPASSSVDPPSNRSFNVIEQDVALGLSIALFFLAIGAMVVVSYRSSRRPFPPSPSASSSATEKVDIDVRKAQDEDQKPIGDPYCELPLGDETHSVVSSLHIRDFDSAPSRGLGLSFWLRILRLGKNTQDKSTFTPTSPAAAEYPPLGSPDEVQEDSGGWQRYLPRSLRNKPPVSPVPEILVHPSDGSPPYSPSPEEYDSPKAPSTIRFPQPPNKSESVATKWHARFSAGPLPPVRLPATWLVSRPSLSTISSLQHEGNIPRSSGRSGLSLYGSASPSLERAPRPTYTRHAQELPSRPPYVEHGGADSCHGLPTDADSVGDVTSILEKLRSNYPASRQT